MSRAKGDLVVIDPDGVALPSATIAFKDADGSTALAQALYAADSGGSSTGSHLTTAKGELTRYAPLAQRAYYRINGDTVNWPVDFEVAPEDVIALADDGVTMTNGYRTLARLRVAAIEAKIRDMGGVVYHVDAAAAALGTAVNDGVGDPDAAVNLCLAAIAATSLATGTVQYGPGTYLATTAAVVWPNNILIRGAGVGITTIKHRASSSVIPINLFQKTDSGVCDLTVYGNYPQNTTYDGCEISVDGTRCFARNVAVTSFNKFGIQAAGTDNVVADCTITGLAPATYTALPAILTTAEIYQSLYGILIADNVSSKRVVITNNVVTGMRSAAIVVGGTGSQCIGNRVENCHRGDFPLNTQGGCIAVAGTKTTVAGDTTSDHLVVGDNYVGPSPTIPTGGGTGGSIGIEIVNTRHSLFINNTINDVRNVGISVNSSILSVYDIVIQGGSIHGVDTAAGLPAALGSVGIVLNGDAGVGGTLGVVVRGVSISSCTNAIWTVNAISAYAFEGLILDSNTTGWTKADAAADWQSFGHVYRSTTHARLPNRFYQADASAAATDESPWAAVFYNSAATVDVNHTSNGVWIRGGEGVLDYSLHVTSRTGSAALDVFGNGSVAIAGDLTVTGFTWTTFTPTLTQSGLLGVTVVSARYRILGKQAVVQLILTVTDVSLAVGATAIIVGIPSAIASARTGTAAVLGSGVYFDTGSQYYAGAVVASAAQNVQLIVTGGVAGALGLTPNITAAVNDVIGMSLAYEIA